MTSYRFSRANGGLPSDSANVGTSYGVPRNSSALAVINTPAPADSAGPGRMRMAGDALRDILMQLGWRPGAADAKGLARLGSLSPAMMGAAAVIPAAFQAVGQFNDPLDAGGTLGNAVDAAGTLGGAAGTALLAARFAPGPLKIPALIAAGLLSPQAGEMGRGMLRAGTDALGLTTSDPLTKEIKDRIRSARANIQVQKEAEEALLPLMIARQQAILEDDKKRAMLNQALTSRQNLENQTLAMMSNTQANSNDLVRQATTPFF